VLYIAEIYYEKMTVGKIREMAVIAKSGAHNPKVAGSNPAPATKK
jgi:hypothetical protein